VLRYEGLEISSLRVLNVLIVWPKVSRQFYRIEPVFAMRGNRFVSITAQGRTVKIKARKVKARALQIPLTVAVI